MGIFKKKNKPEKKVKKVRFKRIRKLIDFFRSTCLKIEQIVKKNIVLELIVAVIMCIGAATMVYNISNEFLTVEVKEANIDYKRSIDYMQNVAYNLGREIDESKLSVKNSGGINSIIEMFSGEKEYKILISDLDGKILYKTDNADEKNIDIYTSISNSLYSNNNTSDYSNKEIINFYPVKFTDGRAYAILKGVPTPSIEYVTHKSQSVQPGIFTLITFIALFFYLTKKKVKYIQHMALGIKEMAKGNLTYRVEIKGKDELGDLAWNINNMATELNNNIERERENERVKNELITNVSHDLRTPLTSIIGYLGLVKDKKFNSNYQMEEYVNIAYNKSEKLKSLIEQLFEYTKFSNEKVRLSTQKIVMNDLMNQLIDEFVPVFEENKLKIVKEIDKEDIIVEIDSDKMVRVFENLFMNCIRYSYKPGEVFIGIKKVEDKVVFSIQNEGDPISKDDLAKLFDRFYRVEKSRSEETGGSGLGLAISKNIVKLHKGEIWAECIGNKITFNVSLNIKEYIVKESSLIVKEQ